MHKIIYILCTALLVFALSACNGEREYFYSSGVSNTYVSTSSEQSREETSSQAGSVNDAVPDIVSKTESANVSSGSVTVSSNRGDGTSSGAYKDNDKTASDWGEVISENKSETSSAVVASKPQSNGSEQTSPVLPSSSEISSENSSKIQYDNDSGWSDWVGL